MIHGKSSQLSRPYLCHTTLNEALCDNKDNLLYPSCTVYKTEIIEELHVDPDQLLFQIYSMLVRLSPML